MIQVDLTEYRQSGPIGLTAAQVRALQIVTVIDQRCAVGQRGRRVSPNARFHSWRGRIRRFVGAHPAEDRYTATAVAGLLRHERGFKPRAELFELSRASTLLPDVLALALAASAARQAFSRGLLHGYRVEEEALYTVRGRIMIAEQLADQVRDSVADRGALRRVHQRHPGEPVGKGGGCTDWAGCGCVRWRHVGSWAGLRGCSRTSHWRTILRETCLRSVSTG